MPLIAWAAYGFYPASWQTPIDKLKQLRKKETPDAAELAEPVRQGFLVKRGAWHRPGSRSHRRWFELRASSLDYYTETGEQRGSIPLGEGTQLVADDDGFTLRGPESGRRTYSFAVDSEEAKSAMEMATKSRKQDADGFWRYTSEAVIGIRALDETISAIENGTFGSWMQNGHSAISRREVRKLFQTQANCWTTLASALEPGDTEIKVASTNDLDVGGSLWIDGERVVATSVSPGNKLTRTLGVIVASAPLREAHAAKSSVEWVKALTTELASDANAGLSKVEVLSVAGFGVGDILAVGTGDAVEKRTLAGLRTTRRRLHERPLRELQFTASLDNESSAGTAVMLQATVSDVDRETVLTWLDAAGSPPNTGTIGILKKHKDQMSQALNEITDFENGSIKAYEDDMAVKTKEVDALIQDNNDWVAAIEEAVALISKNGSAAASTEAPSGDEDDASKNAGDAAADAAEAAAMAADMSEEDIANAAADAAEAAARAAGMSEEDIAKARAEALANSAANAAEAAARAAGMSEEDIAKARADALANAAADAAEAAARAAGMSEEDIAKARAAAERAALGLPPLEDDEERVKERAAVPAPLEEEPVIPRTVIEAPEPVDED